MLTCAGLTARTADGFWITEVKAEDDDEEIVVVLLMLVECDDDAATDTGGFNCKSGIAEACCHGC